MVRLILIQIQIQIKFNIQSPVPFCEILSAILNDVI